MAAHPIMIAALARAIITEDNEKSLLITKGLYIFLKKIVTKGKICAIMYLCRYEIISRRGQYEIL